MIRVLKTNTGPQDHRGFKRFWSVAHYLRFEKCESQRLRKWELGRMSTVRSLLAIKREYLSTSVRFRRGSVTAQPSAIQTCCSPLNNLPNRQTDGKQSQAFGQLFISGSGNGIG